MDLSKQAKGIYYLRIKTRDEITTKKIAKKCNLFFILTVFFLLAVGIQNIYSQPNSMGYLLANGIGGSSSDASQRIVLDGNGNFYIAGYFLGTADFDPGASTANLTSAGSNDMFFAKYNASGNYLWAKRMGGTGADVCQDIVLDASGNVYLSGYFISTVDFDPGAAVVNLTSVGSNDVFFAKYDSNGNYLWAKNFGGTNSDVSNSIAVDASGNVYVTGSFLATADFDPGAGVDNIGSWGGSDIFFAKYNSSGSYLWAKTIGSINGDGSNSMALDASGNILITGYFSGSADFDPGAGTASLTTLSGNPDIFFAKYNSNGIYTWAKAIGSSPGQDAGSRIITDATGNLYVTGYFTGTTDFDPGPGIANYSSIGQGDIFFAKYSSLGNYVWAKTIGSTVGDQGYGITLDANGNIYISGYFQGTANFDPAGSYNLTPVGGLDIYFAKYDASGSFIWANNMGDVIGDHGYDIKVDASGNVYLTGIYGGTVDFDPGAGSAFLTSVSGSSDIFFAKYYQCAVSLASSQTDVSCNGGNNGTAFVTPSGGTSPYTYSWSNGGTTFQISNLTAQVYTVTATDGNGCTATASITITQPAVLTTTVSPTNVKCNGGSNGSVNVSVSGGTSPYTFLWSTSATTQNISNLVPGTYTITITDNNGCIKIDNAVISQPALLNPTVTITNVTCNGLCNGTAAANVTGGTPPYVYQWLSSPNQTTQTATGLCPGNYNVIISDNNNCNVVPSITITQPNILSVSVSITNASCNNADGSSTANPSGGTSPFTYNWSNGNSNQTANNLTAGNYSVAVTDAKSCTASGTSTVVTVAYPQQVCLVTVDSTSSKNVIAWEKNAAIAVDSFKIYREIASAYTLIGKIPYTTLSMFTDTTNGVNPNTTSYKYKVSAVDSCGNESVLSAFHRTMLLQVSLALPPNSYNLSWNDYIGYSVTKYRILRAINSANYIAVDSTSFGTTAWTDANTYALTDTVSFVIEVKHPIGCLATIKNPSPMVINLNSSKSNAFKVIDSTLTSVSFINNEIIVSVYPNPSSGVFTLTSTINHLPIAIGTSTIKIYNVLGEKIHQSSIINNKSEIDLRRYAKGVYHLQLVSGNKIVNKKIIVQ